MAVLLDGCRLNHILIGQIQPRRIIPRNLAITGILFDLPGTLLAVIKKQYRASAPQEPLDNHLS